MDRPPSGPPPSARPSSFSEAREARSGEKSPARLRGAATAAVTRITKSRQTSRETVSDEPRSRLSGRVLPRGGKPTTTAMSDTAPLKYTVAGVSVWKKLSIAAILQLPSLASLLLALVLYVGLCVVFALLYYALGAACYDDDAVEGFSFGDMLWLSVHAFSSIGFGSVYPSCASGQVLVLLEAFTSLVVSSVLAGVVLFQVMRPRARARFSSHLLVHESHGCSCLTFRLARESRFELRDARLQVQALLTATSDGFDRSSEEERTERLRGRQLTESATLQLRSAFASDLRVWQVWHQIDEASPLYRIRDSLKSDLKWVDVSLTAFDQVYMQEVRMHANYTSSDLVEGARFDEMASLDFDGRRHTVDLSKIDAHHYIDARGRRQRTFKRLNVGAMLAKVQWGGVEGAHHRGSVSGASQPHHLNPDGTARRSFEMTSMFRRASRSVRPAPPKLAEALRDAERNREVLVHYEGVGDYAAAVGVVAAAALAPLSDGELRDGAAVRAKVRALNKLGEYKWRYRVVDEGGSPRDEAIAVLEEARGLIAAAIERTPLARQAVARRSWAPELSEALHGLAVARLIFNGDDAEDHTISALLDEALSLRQATPALAAEAAETFNSMGMLRLKRRHLSDAEGHFERSLALRWQLDEGTPEARRDKAKALAQSLTSLGNLSVERGDAAEIGGRHDHYRRALDQLTRAKEEYVKGFGREDHAKVAWALQGIARVHQKLGEAEASQAAWAQVLSIRKATQQKSEGKVLFAEEMADAEKRVNNGCVTRQPSVTQEADPDAPAAAAALVPEDDED